MISPNRLPQQNHYTRGLNGKAGHSTSGERVERVERVFVNCRSWAACRSPQPARPISLIARNLLPNSRSEAVSSRRIHSGLWPEIRRLSFGTHPSWTFATPLQTQMREKSLIALLLNRIWAVAARRSYQPGHCGPLARPSADKPWPNSHTGRAIERWLHTEPALEKKLLLFGIHPGTHGRSPEKHPGKRTMPILAIGSKSEKISAERSATAPTA